MSISPYVDEAPVEILPNHLYLGGHQDPTKTTSFDVVVGVAKERKLSPIDYAPAQVVIHIPLLDDGPPEPDDRARAADAVRLVNQHIDLHQRRVLVTCLAGLNRSAWVVALVLRSRGWTGKAAIELIRSRRGYEALQNEFFERLILRD